MFSSGSGLGVCWLPLPFSPLCCGLEIPSGQWAPVTKGSFICFPFLKACCPSWLHGNDLKTVFHVFCCGCYLDRRVHPGTPSCLEAEIDFLFTIVIKWSLYFPSCLQKATVLLYQPQLFPMFIFLFSCIFSTSIAFITHIDPLFPIFLHTVLFVF